MAYTEKIHLFYSWKGRVILPNKHELFRPCINPNGSSMTLGNVIDLVEGIRGPIESLCNVL